MFFSSARFFLHRRIRTFFVSQETDAHQVPLPRTRLCPGPTLFTSVHGPKKTPLCGQCAIPCDRIPPVVHGMHSENKEFDELILIRIFPPPTKVPWASGFTRGPPTDNRQTSDNRDPTISVEGPVIVRQDPIGGSGVGGRFLRSPSPTPHEPLAVTVHVDRVFPGIYTVAILDCRSGLYLRQKTPPPGEGFRPNSYLVGLAAHLRLSKSPFSSSHPFYRRR